MSPRLAGLLLLALVACDDDGDPITVDAAPIDAFEVAYWTPEPGEASNWDIQLSGTIDVSEPRAMYVLDLWELVPEPTTLDYGDGDPVTVPAGSLAGTIAMLHERTPATIVVCHVNIGAIELDDPDAAKFPGFEASPPDNPTPPAEGSVVGWSTPDGPNERYLDLQPASRARWEAFAWKRLELAKQIGCDAVEPDHADQPPGTPSGFELLPDLASHQGWHEEIARQAHMLELSVGIKNANVIMGLPDALVDDFDWALPERCGLFDDCDTLRPYINARKAVFALDYIEELEADMLDAATACSRHGKGLIEDGLVKDLALTAASRVACGE